MPLLLFLAGAWLANLVLGPHTLFARDTNETASPPELAAPEDPLAKSVYVLGYELPAPAFPGHVAFYPLCTATAVGRRTLVTAAHCLEGLDAIRGPVSWPPGNGPNGRLRALTHLRMPLVVYQASNFLGQPKYRDELTPIAEVFISPVARTDRVRGNVALLRAEEELPGPGAKIARDGERPPASAQFRAYAHGGEGTSYSRLQYARGTLRGKRPERAGQLLVPAISGQRFAIPGGPVYVRTEGGWKLFAVNSGLARPAPANEGSRAGAVVTERQPALSLQDHWCEGQLLASEAGEIY